MMQSTKSHHNTTDTIRLDSYLSSLGVAARRKIEYVLKSKNVLVNEVRATEPGIRIDPKKDQITINGKKVYRPRLEYVLLNKPFGIISSARDEQRRKTVTDLIRSKSRLFPVGRLDKDTTGLIIVTNDGEFTNLLTHPRYHIPKTYRLYVQGIVDSSSVAKFKNGIKLDEGITSKCEATIISSHERMTVVKVVLYQGWKRQIRRMCEVLGWNLVKLERIAIGSVRIGNLKEGEFRNLTEQEIASLQKSARSSKRFLR